MKISTWIIRAWVALFLVATPIHQAQAETADPVGSKLWLPSEMGSGAFSLQPDAVHLYKTVSKNGEPVELKLQAFLPEGHKASDKRPAIVFFHGGGWHGGTPDQFYPQCRYLALRGMVAFSAEYRTIKAYKTTPKECVIDGKSAVRWVRQHAAELGVDPGRLAAGGGSAGGHIAAATALVDGFEEAGEDQAVRCQPDALVLYNPVFDNGPNGFGYNLVKEYWKAISPIDHVDAEAPPAVVFLGTKDKHVPVETGQRFQRLMKEQGRHSVLHLYEGKPHAFFNIWVSREILADTLVKVDRFLASLGYLEGEPIFKLKPGPETTKAAATSLKTVGLEYPLPALKRGSRVLFIGDSITDMNRDKRPNPRDQNHVLGHSFPFILAARLNLDMSGAELTFINRGNSGNKVADLKARWQTDVIDIKPELLTILVGVNDALRGVEPAAYEADYRHILSVSREANPELKLVLLDPFVLQGEGAHPGKQLSARRELTDTYGKVVSRLAKEFDAVHIKTQELFDDAAETAPAEYWLWDGIHPLPQGHELIARHWLKEVSARWPKQ